MVLSAFSSNSWFKTGSRWSAPQLFTYSPILMLHSRRTRCEFGREQTSRLFATFARIFAISFPSVPDIQWQGVRRQQQSEDLNAHWLTRQPVTQIRRSSSNIEFACFASGYSHHFEIRIYACNLVTLQNCVRCERTTRTVDWSVVI